MRHSRYRFFIGGMLLFLNLLYGANFVAITPLFPLIIEDYEISRRSASLLTSLVIMVQATLIIPGGVLVTRFPMKLMLALGWLLGCSMIFVPWADSFNTLLGIRAVFGLGFMFMMPAIAPITMRWFDSRELPIITSLNMAFFALGIGVGTFYSPQLSELIGWEYALAAFGWILLAGWLVWVLFARIPQSTGSRARTVSIRGLWNSMRSKTTLLLGLADGAAYAQYMALTTWLPTYYNQELAMSLSKAGFIVGLMPMVGFCAVLLGGFLASRVSARRPFFIVSGMLVGLGGVGSFAFDSEAIIYLSVIVLGAGSFAYLSVLMVFPMELPGITESDVAVMWAAMFAIASFFAVIAPISVGIMTDVTGSYMSSFVLWAVFSWGLLLAGLLLPSVTASSHTNDKIRMLGTPIPPKP